MSYQLHAPGEPIDPSMFREHIMERWQRLLALAEELRDRDRWYLSGSG